MEGNTTDQDELLAKISGLTSGMDNSSNMGMPQTPQAPVMPSVPETPVMPSAPSYDQMQDLNLMKSPMPNNNLTIDMNNSMSQMNANPMPGAMPQMSMPSDNISQTNNMMQNSMPGAMPQMNQTMQQQTAINDPFAASLGATPVQANDQTNMNQMTNIPSSEVPTMTSRIPTPDNKIPTFDKPVKKKSNGAFGFVVALLILAIIGAGIFALYSNGLLNGVLSKFNLNLGKENTQTAFVDDTQNQSSDIDSFVTEPEVNTSDVSISNAEFVNSTVTEGINDKVVKADYKVTGLKYDANYISLPYLNIQSDDANAINEDLQKKYKDYANISADFRTENEVQLVNDETNFKQRYLIVYYQAITQGDIISLLINELKYDGTDALWNHYTYCISASTGKKLSITDLETILKVDDSAMNQSYESYVTTYISSMTAAESKKIFEHKINAFKTLQDYYANINKGEGIYYYVDGSGRINIITKLYIGDKNLFKVIAYSPASGCIVKEFKINDAKTAAGYTQMTKESLNNEEATNTVASSTLKVNANSLISLNSGDNLYGSDIKKLYNAYEYLLGTKGESLTFQIVTNNGTKSYSKGESKILNSDIFDNDIYNVEVIKYSSGSYRILRFRYEEN